jgi:ABC-type Zn uptake system ZnuABC Zn-binding protein ZnuA
MLAFRRTLAIALLCTLGTWSQTLVTQAQAANPALQPCTPSAAPAKAVASPPATEAVGTAAAQANPSLYVVTTVAPLTNIAFNIAGHRVKVHGLVPEGMDSHTFEPKPSDAAFIAQADIVFINGLHLEEPTRKLAAANLKQGAEVIELGLSTLNETDWVYDFSFPEDQGDPNPHLWMNPLLALNYARIMRDTLSKRDPAGSAFYAANYEQFAARIQSLDRAICDSIATIPAAHRRLLTYHDSFAYFAPRYHMTIIGAIQPADFAEPSAREVARLIDQIREENVPAIFGSEVFPSKVIEQIGKEAGVKFVDTLADDDLPNQTGNRLYHSYLQLLVNDATTMTKALGGDPAPLQAVLTDNLNGPDTAVEISGN